MSSSKRFLCFCLSFAGGVFLDSFFSVSLILFIFALAFSVFLFSVLRQRKKAVFAGFCLLFLLAGAARHSAELSKLGDCEEKQEAVVRGVVSRDPDVRETHQKVTVGKTLITAGKYENIEYGDFLEVKGALEEPEVFEGFNYKDYLKKEGVCCVMYYPEVEISERNRGNFLYEKIFSLKKDLRRIISENISPPEASVLGAIVLGDKRKISSAWQEKLNFAGVRHLTAVSGMHIAVLTAIIMSFLIGLGLNRQRSFYLTIFLAFLFVALTGFQSSAIRAAVMGGIFLTAQRLGRASVSFRALVMAAVLMLAFNPFLLRLDAGFQLSFMAVAGIIYLSPFFRKILKKAPESFQIKGILAMTFSAQVFTLPLLIYNFGYFSLVSPFTNLLIVPLLPLIMVLGFAFLFSGLIWSKLAWFFSIPLDFLLKYLTGIVEIFSSFSFSACRIEISWLWLIAVYLVIGFSAWKINKEEKNKEFDCLN